MSTRSEAEDHLRAIRSLMEKATIYRALSAEAALFGGAVSLGAAAFLFTMPAGIVPAAVFFNSVWLVVLVLTLLVSLFLLRRDARRRNEAFLSAGFRSAARAMMPPLLCGAALSASEVFAGSLVKVPAIWMLCYGLALLAMAHFAPRSIRRLGWAFLLGGLGCLAFGSDLGRRLLLADGQAEALEMAVTFGLLHMAYAFAIWQRKAAVAAPSQA